MKSTYSSFCSILNLPRSIDTTGSDPLLDALGLFHMLSPNLGVCGIDCGQQVVDHLNILLFIQRFGYFVLKPFRFAQDGLHQFMIIDNQFIGIDIPHSGINADPAAIGERHHGNETNSFIFAKVCLNGLYMPPVLHQWVVHLDSAAADGPVGLSSAAANLTCGQVSCLDHEDSTRTDDDMINRRIPRAGLRIGNEQVVQDFVFPGRPCSCWAVLGSSG